MTKREKSFIKKEQKYLKSLGEFAVLHEGNTILSKYLSLNIDDQKNETLVENLRILDHLVNVEWPMVHLKSAGR